MRLPIYGILTMEIHQLKNIRITFIAIPAAYDVSLTITNNCGEDIFTQTVNVVDCSDGCECPPGNNLIVIPSNEVVNISDIPSITNESYCFQVGEDAKLIFDENSTVSYSTFVMDAGSEIEVELNSQFVSNSNAYYGCTNMWRGITVANGGSLVFDGNLIRDAQYAIQPSDGTHLGVKNNTFENNYIGVFVAPPANPGDVNTITNDEPFASNSFTNPSGMKAPFAGQSPAPGDDPLAGILVNNVSMFDIGMNDVSGLTNTFDGLRNGIYTFNSDIGIFDVNISNLIDGVSWINDPYSSTGVGVLVDDGGFLTMKDSDISTCNMGIRSIASSIDVKESNFHYLKFGIYAEHSMDQHSSIVNENNTFFCTNGAIIALNSENPHLDFTSNIINIGQYTPGYPYAISGIQIYGVNANSSDIGLVGGNFVYLYDAMEGITIGSSSNLKIKENEINDYDDFADYGIKNMLRLQGSMDIQLRWNDLFGNNNSGSAFSGMRIRNTTNSVYCCNTVKEVDLGAQFSGWDSGTNYRGTTFDNIFDIGLLLDEDAILSPQFDQVNNLRYGNRWINMGTGSVGAEHFSTDVFEVAESAFTVNSIVPNTMPIPTPPLNWFPDVPGGSTIDCNTNEDCFIQELMIPDGPTETDRKVADGSLNTTMTYDGGLYWEAKRHLYHKLKNHPVLLNQNPKVDSFYTANQNTAIGAFYAIDQGRLDLFDPADPLVAGVVIKRQECLQKTIDIRELNSQLLGATGSQQANLLEDLDSLYVALASSKATLLALQQNLQAARIIEADQLIVDNNAIPAVAVYEVNRKEINNIYLNTIAKGNYGFTTTQLNTIESVAGQCPLSGGNAVYDARALLRSVKDTLFYDDDALCARAGGREEGQKAISSNELFDFSIFPNPTKAHFTISFNAPLQEDTELTLYTLTGKPIRSFSILTGTIIWDVDVSHLSSGMYFCEVTQKGQILKTEKLLIQK